MEKQNINKQAIFSIGFIMILLGVFPLHLQAQRAGNPVFEGWYADPEGVILDDIYWIFPTYSADYNEQVFLDAFSSPDLVNWTKHSRIIDTSKVKWADRAMWAPAIYKKEVKYYFMWSEGGRTGPDYRVAYAISNSPFGFFERIGTILEQNTSIATGAGHHSVIHNPHTDNMVYCLPPAAFK